MRTMKVQELFSDESRWTKYQPASDAEGNFCFVDDENACSFCLLGALVKCYGNEGFNKLFPRITSYICKVTGWHFGHISSFNDQFATFADIQKLAKDLDI